MAYKGSPFQTRVSKSSGLSPFKEETDVDPEIQEDHQALTDYWNDTDPNSLLNKRLRGDFLESESILDPRSYNSKEVTNWNTEISDYYTDKEGYDIDAIKEKVRANLKNIGIDNISDLDPQAESDWNWLNNFGEKGVQSLQDALRVRRILQQGITGSHMRHKGGAVNPGHQMTLSPGQAESLDTDVLDIYGHEAGHATLGNEYNLSKRDSKIMRSLQQIRGVYSGKEDEDITEHHEDVSENYSDLQSVRLDMLRSGLYDWKKEQLTPKVWNEYLDTYKDKDMPLTLKRLIETYRVSDPDMDAIKRKQKKANKDQNIIYINNAIAGIDSDEELDKSSALAMRVNPKVGL